MKQSRLTRPYRLRVWRNLPDHKQLFDCRCPGCLGWAVHPAKVGCSTDQGTVGASLQRPSDAEALREHAAADRPALAVQTG